MSSNRTALAQEREPLPGTALSQGDHHQVAPQNGSYGEVTTTESRGSNDSLHTRADQSIRASLLPKPKVLRPEAVTFRRLEQRDGFVLDVDEETQTFRARLVDPRGAEPDQEVEIDLAQVSPVEAALVKPGALFFWAIGYMTRATGRRNLVLAIEFRRLPRAARDAQESAARDASEYRADMGWS
jgi:hypothetical protein